VSDIKALTTVAFYEDAIPALDTGEHIYVAITSFCRSLGVSEQVQRRAILADPVLARYTLGYTLGQGSPALLIRMDRLNGWLFSINVNRVKPAAREKLIRYREECYDALYVHFYGKASHSRFNMATAVAGSVGTYSGPDGLEADRITRPLPNKRLEKLAQRRADVTNVSVELLRPLVLRQYWREQREERQFKSW